MESPMGGNFGRIYLTEALPGTGGRIKEKPDDFQVEEVPLYPLSGQGGFTFLFVETVNLSTLDLVDRLRDRLGIRDDEVGVAGWKDKHAITRQFVSVPRDRLLETHVSELAGDGLRILHSAHHPHKLRTGHLLGNRFSVLVREPRPGALPLASAILDRVRGGGLANFYGPQRFGASGDNPAAGRDLLTGRRTMRSVRRRKLLVSAYTSLLFNLTLKERMQRGLFAQLLRGDVAKKTETGGLFVVEDPPLEQPRADKLEISATGPIWGKKMMAPKAEALALETEVLTRQGASADLFRRQPGSRRPLRVVVRELALREEPEGLRLEFFLPKGSYATVLLDEIMKTGPGGTADRPPSDVEDGQ